ncbi:alpha/beta fold hydrolase [Helicobacter himalayensis]|uniref:alpha/beta fold hydrolase n=1 Tax=Helicobacter himalayensis TaxID=1591088 RepID=UPI00082C860F|nr:alpha/beta hydrolase [Helicobacter himalayensis]
MIKTSGNFQSDFGAVVYDIYEPDSGANGANIIIQIAHGMVEHRGRFEWVARELAQNGYIVAINDHRGHGDSINTQSAKPKISKETNHTNANSIESTSPIITLGEMGEQGFERAVQDMHVFNHLLHSLYPHAQIVLLGHSMGSLLSRRYVSLYEDSVIGLILSGSPAYNPLSTLGIALGKFFHAIGAKDFGAKILNALSFGGFNAKFRTEGSPYAWLCSDKNVVSAYENDKKCNFIFTTQSFINLFGGLKCVYGAAQPPKNPRFPVLIISGRDDACGDFGKGVEKLQVFLRKNGYQNTQLILYNDARHEILNDFCKKQVLQDILLWITKHLRE